MRKLRAEIAAGRLPPLPPSKTGGDLCPGFHGGGVCNKGCARVADHVQYTAEELQPFADWCELNWPAAVPAP